MPSADPQVLKGILSMLLLQVLDTEDSYGYAVVVRLRELGLDGLGEGTVYPALSRLESRGLLSSHLVASDSGPARKYYRPTESGALELTRAAQGWTALKGSVDRIMSTSSIVATPSSLTSEEH